MVKVSNKNNGKKVSTTDVLENILNNSIEQPEIVEDNEIEALNISSLNEIEALNIELAKLGLQKVNVNASQAIQDAAWRRVRQIQNEIEAAKKEKVIKPTLEDLVQIEHKKRFKDSFLEKMFNLGKYNLIEAYFSEKELSTTDFLEYFKSGVFKIQGVCDLKSDTLVNALKSNQAYYKLDGNFLHFFTDSREYRIKLSQFDLLKHKTDNSLLEAKGASIINVKLPFAKSELAKAQKIWAEKKAEEVATKGESKVSEYISDTRKRVKVVRELNKH